MNIVGTPYSDVQRSAWTVSSAGQRLERLAGHHHARAVGGAGQVAEHHAEAVVERHGDADAVALGVAAAPRR